LPSKITEQVKKKKTGGALPIVINLSFTQNEIPDGWEKEEKRKEGGPRSVIYLRSNPILMRKGGY